MKARALAINVALAVGSLLAVALAAEVALRVVLLRNLNPFEPDAALGFRLKAGFEGAYPRIAVRTDSLGRRIPLEQAGDASGRWLFLGDSVTFGFGVAAEDAFPWRLARALGDPAGATVAAVPGYNLGQAVAAGRESLAHARPEIVVYGLVVNDPGGAARPATYQDIDPHAARSAEGGFLSRSMLVAFVDRRVRRITASLDPDEEGDGDGGHFPATPDALGAETLAAFDRQWAELERLAADAGAPAYVLICPYRRQIEDPATSTAFQEFAAARCASGPLVCLDPLAELRAHAGEELFNGTSSYHYNERGHALLADWLLERVREGRP